MNLNKLKKFIDTRFGFFTLVTFLFWAKTIFAYYVDFHMEITSIYQHFVLWFSPLAFTLFLFSFMFYFRKGRNAYFYLILILIANSALIIFNIIYYREFTDFLTVNSVLGFGKVSQGISGSTLALFKPWDFVYVLDIIVLIVLLFMGKIKIDDRQWKKKKSFAMTSFSLLLFTFNLVLGEIDRPQLLTRTFDRQYIVKYLGLDFYTIYDSFKTAQNTTGRVSAESSDVDDVLAFTQSHYAAPNSKYYGMAKGRNVIYIHLESFQQFLIDYKLDGQTVTPFLNSLYHDKQTFAFENFFHQVGQGKTSDAENLLENSLYGLPQGSAFAQVGSDNTYQSAPAILEQTAGYSSAVFHTNKGTFWNRNNVYKQLGFNYFFDGSYYDKNTSNSSEYGMKDKLFFQQSVQYLEQLQQPFYTKFITVTNHFPYPIDANDLDITLPNTSETSVNDYFGTAKYLDQSIEEFFNYLKKSGLYDNSVIILYGDHFGISNSRNLALAPLLGKSAETWTDYDNAMLQRVPYMIHIPGQEEGGIQKQYAGEVDALPTLLHLLGIDNKNYIQFGSDALSEGHDQIVAFRNGNFVTPKYTMIGSTIYETDTGVVITHPDAEVTRYIDAASKQVQEELSYSDKVNNKNLLRFYTPIDFKPVDPTQYNYTKQLEALESIRERKGIYSTSLYSEKDEQSTTVLYQTDAPKKEVTTTTSSEKAIE